MNLQTSSHLTSSTAGSTSTISARRRRLIGAAALLPLAAHAPVLRAQSSWPTKPIHMVVAASAGSGGDIVARIITDGLSRKLGQPVIVDNRPGATGIVATESIIKAPPDGYTFLFTYAAAIAVNHTLQPRLRYDTFKDLVPVAQVGSGGNLLVVTPDMPVKTLKEFVDFMKRAPDRYNYASWGIGSGGHLVMEDLKMQTGIPLDHVPYTSMPKIYNDLQNGAIKVAFVDTSSSVPLINAGRLRALAISGTRRAPLLPDLPTMTEQGFKFDTDSWYGVFAPAGTPAAIVDRMNLAIDEVLKSPESADKLRVANLADTPHKSPEAFAQQLRTDIDIWKRIIQTANVKID